MVNDFIRKNEKRLTKVPKTLRNGKTQKDGTVRYGTVRVRCKIRPPYCIIVLGKSPFGWTSRYNFWPSQRMAHPNLKNNLAGQIMGEPIFAIIPVQQSWPCQNLTQTLAAGPVLGYSPTLQYKHVEVLKVTY